MPFSLPTFNILFQAKANFNFNLGANPIAPFIHVNTACNLAYSKRNHNVSQVVGALSQAESLYLLFPTGVGLKGRASYAVKNGDAVEVPTGSGRWYTTVSVDFVGKGFANEHMAAVIAQPYNLFLTAPVWP